MSSLSHNSGSEPAFTEQPKAYLSAVAIVFVTALLAFPAHQLMPHANLSLLFLTGILIISARTGLGPSLVASVLSFLTFNFLFTPPYYTFEVADDGDVATLIFFLLMAAITGNLAARMHQEISKRRTSLRHISTLYDFTRRMSSAAEAEDILSAVVVHFQHFLKRQVVIFIPSEAGLPVLHSQTDGAPTIDQEVIGRAWAKVELKPYFSGQWSFLPLSTDWGLAGMVAIQDSLMESENLELCRSLCRQAAIALHRTQLAADLEHARLVSETEQLRSALLSSVSHDLRTPLSSIIGSTTSLLEYGETFSSDNRKDLLKTVVEEARRLDRHIQNLLDMTRLGQGALTLRRDWVDLHDIVASAISRLPEALKELSVQINIAHDVPLLWVHGVLIEQALVNLLDNAARFSPANGKIEIHAHCLAEEIEIKLCDEGPGIPEGEREKIFDMFFTARQGDRSNFQGTGLGLAIVRGMVAAHGGSVSADSNPSGQGTCMSIRLPLTMPEKTPA
ncbi:MAG: DUF4118 domain-containing protein [Sedimenticola sp.]|uniref:histidine kinase n=1 Tax=Sedimenticola thiotaurini TaxID=1543721 RepID=A0A558CYV5_9GAMM|nr:DUF4118 domain-containing protein [Sedimenticola sp.]MCW8949974.1 DUF4118 domain-containing protein [Sedimenticola sp.]TVT53893.1 MAG: DUF4118 domain-containing protein [Sedimenticola thiotaurini]